MRNSSYYKTNAKSAHYFRNRPVFPSVIKFSTLYYFTPYCGRDIYVELYWNKGLGHPHRHILDNSALLYYRRSFYIPLTDFINDSDSESDIPFLDLLIFSAVFQK